MPHIHISAAILKIAAILYLSYSVIISNIKSWLRPFVYKIVNFKLYRVYFNGISFDFGSHLGIGSHFVVFWSGTLYGFIIKANNKVYTEFGTLNLLWTMYDWHNYTLWCTYLLWRPSWKRQPFWNGPYHFLISRT